MVIATSNLSHAVNSSVENDIATVLRGARMEGRAVPGIKLHLVSLSSVVSSSAHLPAHDLLTPAAQMPVAFAARCAWEKRRQSFQLIEDEETCWIVGGDDTGVLYGVGEWLRCRCGVIWANPDDKVLFGEACPLPVGVQRPELAYRGRDGSAPDEDMPAFVRWLSRNRYNLWRRNSAWWQTYTDEKRKSVLEQCEERGLQVILGDHALHYFLPEEKFEQHPEWFGMREGVRCRHAFVTLPDCPHLNAELPVQPCFSNALLVEYLTDRMAAHMRDNPKVHLFGLWPHDGVNNWCQCEACLQRSPYEHMYLMAQRLERKLPQQVAIELIAYSNLLNPPRQALPPSERTFTMLCPYLRHYDHRIFDAGGPEAVDTGNRYPEPDRINPADDREYGLLFRRWQEVCNASGSVLGVYEYGAQFYDETRRIDRPRYLYHPPHEVLRDEIRWYVQNGAQVFSMCSIYRGWPDSYHEIVLAAEMWAPANAVELRRSYYQALAGDAGPALDWALQEVAGWLMREDEPGGELDRLEGVAHGLPGPLRTGYLSWCRYLRLGKQARSHELEGEYAEALHPEAEICALLREQRPQLGAHVAGFLNGLTEIGAQRLRERASETVSSGYVL